MSQELSSEVQEIRALFRETSNQIREVAKWQKEQPYTIFIENLRHPSYRLRHPIPVLIERDDDTIIATYHDVDMWGTGADVQDAISDLCDAIVEYYETLKEDEGNLGLLPSQEYAHLKGCQRISITD